MSKMLQLAYQRSYWYEVVNDSFRAACFAEFLGMMYFIVLGVGGAMTTLHAANPVLLEIAMSFGFSIMAIAQFIGPISGAHLNCAVTLALFIGGRISGIRCVYYIGHQLFGAFIGALFLLIIFGKDYNGKNQNFASNEWNSQEFTGGEVFLAEMFGTAILIFNVFATIDHPIAGGGVLGMFPISMSVLVAHLYLIPIDGCSINPTRSFGPWLIAVYCGSEGAYRNQQYMFWFGPMIGASLTALFYEYGSLRHELRSAGGDLSTNLHLRDVAGKNYISDENNDSGLPMITSVSTESKFEWTVSNVIDFLQIRQFIGLMKIENNDDDVNNMNIENGGRSSNSFRNTDTTNGKPTISSILIRLLNQVHVNLFTTSKNEKNSIYHSVDNHSSSSDGIEMIDRKSTSLQSSTSLPSSSSIYKSSGSSSKEAIEITTINRKFTMHYIYDADGEYIDDEDDSGDKKQQLSLTTSNNEKGKGKKEKGKDADDNDDLIQFDISVKDNVIVEDEAGNVEAVVDEVASEGRIIYNDEKLSEMINSECNEVEVEAKTSETVNANTETIETFNVETETSHTQTVNANTETIDTQTFNVETGTSCTQTVNAFTESIDTQTIQANTETIDTQTVNTFTETSDTQTEIVIKENNNTQTNLVITETINTQTDDVIYEDNNTQTINELVLISTTNTINTNTTANTNKVTADGIIDKSAVVQNGASVSYQQTQSAVATSSTPLSSESVESQSDIYPPDETALVENSSLTVEALSTYPSSSSSVVDEETAQFVVPVVVSVEPVATEIPIDIFINSPSSLESSDYEMVERISEASIAVVNNDNANNSNNNDYNNVSNLTKSPTTSTETVLSILSSTLLSTSLNNLHHDHQHKLKKHISFEDSVIENKISGNVTTQEIVDPHHDDVKALTAGPITSTTTETDALVIKAPIDQISSPPLSTTSSTSIMSSTSSSPQIVTKVTPVKPSKPGYKGPSKATTGINK